MDLPNDFFRRLVSPEADKSVNNLTDSSGPLVAVGNSGDTQIELICCENDAPSVYKEFLDAGRSGVHHVGLMPENFAETCNRYQALGFEAAFECSIAGTHLVYYDTVETLGHFTELWDRSESFIEFQRSVKEAARNWDGSDPVRRGAV